MSEENVICSHHLVIRFDPLPGNRVNWYLIPDEQIEATRALGLIDLAECEAPLAALGIRALWKLLQDGLVYHALEQANGIQAEVRQRLAAGCSVPAMDWAAPDRTVN